MNNPTIAGLMAPLLETAPIDQRLEITFDDVTVVLTSNSQALTDKLGRYFRDFLGGGGQTVIEVTAIEAGPPAFDLPFAVHPREPGKTKLKEASIDLPDGRVVHKLLTGLVFLFGQGKNYAVGPCLENDNQVVNFINNRFIENRLKRGALLFHAAGVAMGGAGLVIAGFAGAGKSTLALDIMGQGTDFISNDRVMVSREGANLTMAGVAKMPRINPGTVLNNPNLASVMNAEDRARFSALPQAELWDLEHKYDAFIDECFGPGRFKLACPMAGLVILRWKRDASPLLANRVDLRQRRDLMPAFMKDMGLFYEFEDPAEPSMASQNAYLSLLGDVPVLEIDGGVDFAKAARVCLEFLESVRR
ncbi:HprK-related kinase B [Desulfovibrio aerotolerans]|uniref:HprK-related kinase B n=1 Tax=Solidesulfovibrio aerotolerans TaxID=295255 RepID=A0A7C9INA7_9BACT|nr:HprK-related kinase B [Solidesulfovibrio aerotolerans]MYL83039.1 HprK-related kinase B [Solidesulfovibrio aerotolerans]